MILPQVTRLERLVLNVTDLRRSCRFYIDALGFEAAEDIRTEQAVLSLGAQEIVLAQAPPDASPYPIPRSADDPWFQHFAIAVADMDAAYAQLRPHVNEPISRDGPERLPPSTGSVTAYKFRDPDGHPLELSYAPRGAWAAMAGEGGPLFLGIDHTALAVADLGESAAFYARLGLRPGPRLLNHGPEQDRLDGLDDVQLDIALLFTAAPGPHVELLHYRGARPGPTPGAAQGGIASTRTVFSAHAGSEACDLRDPDGHLLSVLPSTALPEAQRATDPADILSAPDPDMQPQRRN